jgi:hypothetical protein
VHCRKKKKKSPSFKRNARVPLKSLSITPCPDVKMSNADFVLILREELMSAFWKSISTLVLHLSGLLVSAATETSRKCCALSYFGLTVFGKQTKQGLCVTFSCRIVVHRITLLWCDSASVWRFPLVLEHGRGRCE